MTGDAARLSAILAADESISDYDFWRALRTLNDQLYQLQRHRSPIPIRLLYARRVLRGARMRRRRG